MKYFKNFFLALIIVTFSLGGCSKNENMKTNKIEKEELVVEEDCLPRESTDFAFVIDGSGSMLKNDKEKLRISKAEVIVNSMKEKDRATVVAFDKQAEVLINGITTNQGDIISALNQVPSDGELTDISSGIELASKILNEENNGNQKVIITLTDGANDGEISETTEVMNMNSYQQAIKSKNNGIIIYTIGLGAGIDESLLEKLAHLTGGEYFHAESNFDLEDVYSEINKEMICLPNKNLEQDDSMVVFIPDKSLEFLIREILGLENNTRDLTEKDLENLISLSSENIDVDSIRSLKGLEYAKNLKEIYFPNQAIEDLSSLMDLPLLNSVFINGKKINILEFLSEKEKEIYANYIVELENESQQKVVYGDIIDIDKNGIRDMVIAISEEDTIPYVLNKLDIDMYIKVLTIANGKLEVLYETSKGDAKEILNEDSIFSSRSTDIYIKQGDNLEYVIGYSGIEGKTVENIYRFFTLKEDLTSVETELKVGEYHCSAGDEECVEDTDQVGYFLESKPLKGNIELADLEEFINSERTMRINSDNLVESEFLKTIRGFATTKVVSRKGLEKDGIILLIQDRTRVIQDILNDSKARNESFNQVRPKLLSHATEELTDGTLKSYYADMCNGCDNLLFYSKSDYSLDFRMDISENTSKKVIINTHALESQLESAGFWEYQFTFIENQWKLADVQFNPLDGKNFDITLNEALEYVKRVYLESGYNHVKTSIIEIEHNSVGEEVYIINIETENNNFKVSINSDDGLLLEL